MSTPGTGTSSISRQLKLQAAIAEYQALRTEILQKFTHHLQIYSITTTSITIMVGYVLTQNAYDLLLAMPIVSSSLAFRYLWEQKVIVMIEGYLRMMETEIFPTLLEDSTELDQGLRSSWVGWQHYFHSHFSGSPFYKYAVETLFVIVPILPALIYSTSTIAAWFSRIPSPTGTGLPIELHFAALAVYAPLAVYLSRRLWKE